MSYYELHTLHNISMKSQQTSGFSKNQESIESSPVCFPHVPFDSKSETLQEKHQADI